MPEGRSRCQLIFEPQGLAVNRSLTYREIWIGIPSPDQAGSFGIHGVIAMQTGFGDWAEILAGDALGSVRCLCKSFSITNIGLLNFRLRLPARAPNQCRGSVIRTDTTTSTLTVHSQNEDLLFA